MARKKAEHHNKVILLIGAGKLLKGLLLFVVAFGALRFVNRDLSQDFSRLIQHLNVDPDSKFFRTILEKVGGFDSHKLILTTIGTSIYGALFLTEGIGLLLEKHWAEYFALIITGSFLPLEIYELCKHPTVLKIGTIILNAAIVVYLAWRLITKKKSRESGGA